ncbi:MAG TPA: GNAT family N-acetyltransferase [Dictyobacter sp.]|jgi:GNAT superfamily N-acetyltransferase|nr:GNAT family N-acetyltransferase [Dictyobacter sp.]
MPVGVWWSGDTLPDLAPLPSFSVRLSNDAPLIAEMAELSLEEVNSRFAGEHRLYLAYLDETPVAYGWVATKTGAITELGLMSFPVVAGDRYLWDFKTLPDWRGQGIYPRLLQGIVRQEQPSGQHFYIGYAPDNESSKRGITKAGFQTVGDFVLAQNNGIAFAARTVGDVDERARAAASFFQLSIVSSEVS